MGEDNVKRLKRTGITYILRGYVGIVLLIIIFFAAAGRFNIPIAWFFFCATFVNLTASNLLLSIYNPEVLNYRGGRRFKEGTKIWDKILLTAYGIFGLYIQLAVAGLDIGRFQWSRLGFHFIVSGYLLYAVSAVLVTWTMAINPHFEPTVRIQRERDHHVVTSGPYRIVRHPGYVAGIIMHISMALMLGSLFGLIPASIAALLLIVRTVLEDKTLYEELKGYQGYAQTVKYRLIPGIW